jgi:hypothetical protein
MQPNSVGIGSPLAKLQTRTGDASDREWGQKWAEKSGNWKQRESQKQKDPHEAGFCDAFAVGWPTAKLSGGAVSHAAVCLSNSS